MSDEYVEVSSQGWFSRIADSIKGIFTGFLMFIIAFPLLFWNECRSVATYQELQAGRGAVVEAPSNKVDSSLDGKLVHVTGTVKVDEKLSDPVFPVTVEGLKLVREVQMYQWDEDVKTEKKKKVGGKQETTKTYSYKQKWSSSVIDSSKFKKKKSDDGKTVYSNPGAMAYEDETIAAKNATMGPYKLTDSIIGKVGKTETHKLDDKVLAKLPADLKGKAKINDGKIYIGKDPSSPAVGDLRISFQVGKPGPITIISGQSGDTFKPFKSKAIKGGMEMASNGTKTADEMFKAAEDANAMMTWILRFVGWLLMFIGLGMIFRPLSVLADVIPFIGSAIGFASSAVAFLIATFFAFLTIAVAWVVARPLLGILLLAIAGLMFGGVIFLAITMSKKKKTA
jgi:hypothetical protein